MSAQDHDSSRSQPCGAPESAATEGDTSAAFSRVDFVTLRWRADCVSDAAHLCYWFADDAQRQEYHRAELIREFDALTEFVERLRRLVADGASSASTSDPLVTDPGMNP